MYIRDNETNKVRIYGTDRHDSLVVSQDGRYLEYRNLQNGDGSIGGGYSFTDVNGNIPVDNEDEYGTPMYFNIGGFAPNQDINEAVYQYGYEKAVYEMHQSMRMCKEAMRKHDESYVEIFDMIEQILEMGLKGVKSPHSDTKTNEG